MVTAPQRERARVSAPKAPNQAVGASGPGPLELREAVGTGHEASRYYVRAPVRDARSEAMKKSDINARQEHP